MRGARGECAVSDDDVLFVFALQPVSRATTACNDAARSERRPTDISSRCCAYVEPLRLFARLCIASDTRLLRVKVYGLRVTLGARSGQALPCRQ